jgi:hypothetical protein
MEEPYGEGLASHTDPESCRVSRKAGPEALTGAHVGGVLSRGTSRKRKEADVFSGSQTHRGKSQNLVAWAEGERETKSLVYRQSHLQGW